MRASRAGDGDAFGRLVDQYYAAAMAVAYGCMGNEHDAMDAVQEAFAMAYCKLGQLRDDSRFAPWLRTIVRNTARRMGSQSRGRQESAYESMETFGVGIQGRDQDHADLHEIVGLLPQKLREPVILYYFQHWSYSRIATFVGIPVSTVKGRLHRARQRLRGRLDPAQEKGTIMKDTEAKEKIREAIHKIATIDIHEEIPMEDAHNVVIFAMVGSDIHLCHTDGDAVIINGTKAAFGEDHETASQLADGMSLLHDHVQDADAVGPHDGQVLAGTRGDHGKLSAITRSTQEGWQSGKDVSVAESFSVGHDLYPDMAKPDPQVDDHINCRMVDALRISLVREEIVDITMPAESVDEDLARLMHINYDDGTRVHGEAGRISMTVAIPQGRGVTVISPMMMSNVHAEDLKCDLICIGVLKCVVKDVDGDVTIIGRAQDISNISGRYVQCSYLISGGSQHEDAHARGKLPDEIHNQTIRDVKGGVHIDGFDLSLDCTGLRGDVRIRNCFGKTRFNRISHQDGDRVELKTHSGEVEVFLREELVEEVSVTATSMTGSIRRPGLKPQVKLREANDGSIILTSTIISDPSIRIETPADITIQSHDGDILIDKTS